MIDLSKLITSEDKKTLDIKNKKIENNNQSLKYLDDTDWYVIRKQETGVEIPEDVLIKRQTARDAIVHIKE